MKTNPIAAMEEGQLNLYNWGNYTSPEMIERVRSSGSVFAHMRAVSG